VITFQVEVWADYTKDCGALWEENCSDHASEPLDPDFAAYEALETAGKLRILTVRRDGEMIGYIIFVIYSHPHHAGLLCGHEDAFYLRKKHRKGITGAKMIREGVRLLKAEGVQRVFFTTDAANNCGPLLEALGFEKSNVVYSIWVS
jgi:hypothetical protein